jgi:hypothetical protein
MREIMATLDIICAYMGRQSHQASEDECDEFEGLTEYFGHLWRTFLCISVPPKFHILETHASEQFRYFRNLGDTDEQFIEHLHHTMNKWNRVFANVTSWKRKQEFQYRRYSATPQTGLLVKQADSNTSRPISLVKKAKRDEKLEQKRSARSLQSSILLESYHSSINLDSNNSTS